MISSFIASIQAAQNLPQSPPSDDFWMPKSASTLSGDVDWLYNVLFWLSVVSALAIFAVMWHFVRKYRVSSRDDSAVGDVVSEHNTALEITWSVIPLFVVIALFVWGFKGYVNLRTPPKEALEIHVQGQKWKWIFTYPNGHSDTKLHVPVDRDVRVIIQSADVLHSLFIPAFRVKMDAVPGRYTDLWFNATEPGDYPIFCAEYCGTSHSDMLAQVTVHPSGGYEKWLDGVGKKRAEEAMKDPVAFGEKLWDEQGCSTCHSIDGTIKVGPSWKGIFGETHQMADGTAVKVDENYIRESINDPTKRVVAGFPPSMPTYQGRLKDYEITAIIEFIKSLKK